MAEKLPLVYVDGGLSQLPPGDSVDGVQLGTLTAGSGLVGGGDLNTGNKRYDVALAANASGLIFVGDALNLDGVADETAYQAYLSGVAALPISADALSSGVAAQAEATTALLSGNAALTSAVNFIKPNTLQVVAAGAISPGYAVGLDDTGRVQSIGWKSDVNYRTFGTPTVFKGTGTQLIYAAYDSINNKILVSYADIANSNYGTSVVATVSGTSVSYGTPAVFESALSNFISSAYNSSTGSFVISYRDAGNSNYGTAVVATITGTSVSFGTPVVFKSDSISSTFTIYDPANNRIVILYRHISATLGTAVVATISGTSVSFGAEATYGAGVAVASVASFDSLNNKVVVTFGSDPTNNYPSSVVGTVSGTSISFGVSTIISSINSTSFSSSFNTTSNKVVSAYSESTSTSFGSRAAVGTVSGTTISYGATQVISLYDSFNTNSIYESSSNRHVIYYRDALKNNSYYGSVALVSGSSLSVYPPVFVASGILITPSLVYDSLNDKTVLSYNDTTTNSGFYIVSSTGQSPQPTLNSLNNFLGVAQTAATSGTVVTVLTPTALDYTQTSLSPGSFYYVNPTTSGVTSSSGILPTWSGAYSWSPVGKAVSSSGLLLLNPL